MSLGRAVTGITEQVPAARNRNQWFSMETPPFGLGYYRYKVTETPTPTAQERAGRQEEGTAVPVRSLSVTQLGVTLAQTLLPGVHAGATVKYLRGTLRTGAVAGSTSDVLDFGEDLEGGDADSKFDLDIGVIAVGGPIRVGAVMRNVTRPEFDGNGLLTPFRLPRQVRVGAAFDGSNVGSIPLVIAVDADVRTYEVSTGDRRVVAVGAEHWLLTRRLGLRAGARFNTVGLKERAATAGASVAVRSGLYLEGQIVGGGSIDERGWGAAARVSF
jgi:hypothetical protein